MKLIDTYVQEIGKYLPAPKRQDIENEILSVLQDTLEDRSQHSDRPIDDEMIVEVLKEYGAPETVASSYLPDRYLVGPRLFPLFMLVVRIVLLVIAVLTVINLGVELVKQQLTFLQTISLLNNGLLGFVSSAVQALGNIVIVFAVLQWLVPNLKPGLKTWDPRTLRKIQPGDYLGFAKPISDIVFTMAALIIFNFYPQIVRVWNNTNGVWTSYEVFTAAFFAYIPLWTVVWVLQVILNIVLLRQGRWQTWTRWAAFGLSAVSIAILAVMLAGPALIQVSIESLLTQLPTLSVENAAFFVNSIQLSARLVLVIIIIIHGIDIIKSLLRFLARQVPSVAIPIK